MVRQTLLNCEDQGWNALYASAAVEGYSHHMLKVLDEGDLKDCSTISWLVLGNRDCALLGLNERDCARN